MSEERTFENPRFARKASSVFAAAIAAGLLGTFVSSEWNLWARLLTEIAGMLAAVLVVRVLFWKFAGVPMWEPRTLI